MTPEYVQRAGWVWAHQDEQWGWADPDDGQWMLPALCCDGFNMDAGAWAGFAGILGDEFLDHQYVYDAFAFNNLSGGKWKTFRRNIRKWPKRHGGGAWRFERLFGTEHHDQISDVLEKWAGDRTDIQDPAVLVDYVLNGNVRWGLFRENELVGLNVGDVAPDCGVYRYCIDIGEPFLNEFLRYCFFRNSWAQQYRWINDGGDLGNVSLQRFKRKLNPVAIHDVYSFHGKKVKS